MCLAYDKKNVKWRAFLLASILFNLPHTRVMNEGKWSIFITNVTIFFSPEPNTIGPIDTYLYYYETKRNEIKQHGTTQANDKLMKSSFWMLIMINCIKWNKHNTTQTSKQTNIHTINQYKKENHNIHLFFSGYYRNIQIEL